MQCSHPVGECHPAVEVEVQLVFGRVRGTRVVVEARHERLRVQLVLRARVAPAPPVAQSRHRTRLGPLVPTVQV